MIPVMSRTLSLRLIASDQVVISSPAAVPTMVAPRIRPRRVVTTLIWPAGFALGLGAVILVVGPAQDLDIVPPAAGLRFGQADMRQFRIGKGDPRNRVRLDLAGEAKQRIPDHEPGMIVGAVGELWPAGGVANGVDAPIGGAQVPVDPHALAS